MDTEFNIANGITSILIWSLVPVIISYLSLRNKRFRKVLEGTPTVFVKSGKILEQNLRKEKYTVDELMEQIRKQRIFHLSDLEYASLEPTGEISVLLKKNKQPLTYGDIFRHWPTIKEPQTLIMEGEIIEESLSEIGLNRSWLNEEIDKLGIKIEDVFFAQVDNFLHLTVDLYEDQLK